MKVLLDSLRLKGDNLGFHRQTRKLHGNHVDPHIQQNALQEGAVNTVQYSFYLNGHTCN